MSGIVVMLTALPMEYQALRTHLTGLEEHTHPKGTIFEVGRLPGSRWRVALAEIGEGNRSAAIITERAHSWLDADAVFFVGIAGGLKKDIALGDVVVATKVYGYHGGGQTAGGFQARPAAWWASHRLEQAARAALRDPRWTRRLSGADDGSRRPEVHFKPIAAGEVVLDDATGALAGRLEHHYNDAAAIEMESAGVAQAAHLSGDLQTLTIRGISDKADGRKRRADAAGSQPRAAAHAAAAALAVLDRLTVSHRAAIASDPPSDAPGASKTSVRPRRTPVVQASPAEARRPDTRTVLASAATSYVESVSLVHDSRRAEPAVMRMLVGRRLCRLRRARGLTREVAGEAIRAPHSKISQLELGRIGFDSRDVADLLTLYGVNDGIERAGWLALAELANAPTWLHDYRDLLPSGVVPRLEAEQEAGLIRSYEAQFVPGLLQTPDYCRLTTRLGRPGAPADLVERHVSLLGERQRLLHQPRPPALWAVIDESALRRRFPDTATMRAQLRHLLDISALCHVTIQVMPFPTGVTAGGAFTLLRFSDPELPDVIYLEHLTGVLHLDREADINHYQCLIDRLATRAEPATATTALLHRILKET